MMPELGKYADAVLSSYIVSIILLIVLVAMSLRAATKARAELQKLEERRRG